MGLDQFAYKRKGRVDDEIEICRWRKHADLEGWMAALFYKRNRLTDKDIVFNCKYLRLHKEDILSLQENYLNLEKGKGFFWGESNQQDNVLTKDFIEKSLKAIDEGYEIYYYSWW